MSFKPTVFVVDDDQAICQSLEWMLQSVKLQVETHNSASSFLSSYKPDRPGCLLLDIRMPDMSGLELQQLLASKKVHMPVIILTGHGDVPTAVRAMKAGAFDFLEKPFSGQVLIDAVQKALEHEDKQRSSRETIDELKNRLSILSARERQVLGMVVDGKASKVIADELGISVHTVENHRAHIMEKVKATSLAHLVRMVCVSNQRPD